VTLKGQGRDPTVALKAMGWDRYRVWC